MTPFTLLNPEGFPNNVLFRRDIVLSSEHYRELMDSMNADDRTALIKHIIRDFELVIAVVQVRRGAYAFYCIKGQRTLQAMASDSPGLHLRSKAGFPVFDVDEASALYQLFGDGAVKRKREDKQCRNSQ